MNIFYDAFWHESAGSQRTLCVISVKSTKKQQRWRKRWKNRSGAPQSGLSHVTILAPTQQPTILMTADVLAVTSTCWSFASGQYCFRFSSCSKSNICVHDVRKHKMCLRYPELEFSPETRYTHRRWCRWEDIWSAASLGVSSLIGDSRCWHMMIREKKQKIANLNHSTDFLYQGLREALVELWTAISCVILGVRGYPKYVYVALFKDFTAISRLLGGIVEGTLLVSSYLLMKFSFAICCCS